jgi:hypothetical protein
MLSGDEILECAGNDWSASVSLAPLRFALRAQCKETLELQSLPEHSKSGNQPQFFGDLDRLGAPFRAQFVEQAA